MDVSLKLVTKNLSFATSKSYGACVGYEAIWRDHVRDFISQHHQRAFDTIQPCLFGIGLYELHSAASIVILVQETSFELDDNIFNRFVHHNNRPNHHTSQGFRFGRLMILGVPLDFRNDYDISSVVAAFRKFHHLH
jgi:hypothetical protein